MLMIYPLLLIDVWNYRGVLSFSRSAQYDFRRDRPAITGVNRGIPAVLRELLTSEPSYLLARGARNGTPLFAPDRSRLTTDARQTGSARRVLIQANCKFIAQVRREGEVEDR